MPLTFDVTLENVNRDASRSGGEIGPCPEEPRFPAFKNVRMLLTDHPRRYGLQRVDDGRNGDVRRESQQNMNVIRLAVDLDDRAADFRSRLTHGPNYFRKDFRGHDLPTVLRREDEVKP